MTTMREAADLLAAAGVPSAQHDAAVLLRHAAATNADASELLAARAARVPLQHLVGSAGFRYLDIEVGPGVFVPRPESELLVDVVLAAVRDSDAPRVVDLCAGSGAIGLSVAHECPKASVHLVERSAEAFPWLERNAATVAAGDRVSLHLADLHDAPSGLDGLVDVVVSNPPYVAHGERELVDPEVLDHDPGVALWAGEEGLDVIRAVAGRAMQLLRPGGTVVVEHSDRQGESAPRELSAAGFVDVVDHKDLTDRPRFSVGTRP